MTPAELIESARSLIEADPDAVGLMDRCSLIVKTFADGGTTGDTETSGSAASDVPCLVEPAGKHSQIVVGGEAYLASHRIYMIRGAQTLLITPKYLITVAARDDKAAMTFEKPAIMDESTDVLVAVAATLVQQGFQ